MKKWLILLIIGLVGGIGLGWGRFRLEKAMEEKMVKEVVDVREIEGGLRVRRGQLVDGRGKIVRLRGVATKAFRWERNDSRIDFFWKRWEIVRKYGANLIMVYIYPDTFKKFVPELDKLVARAQKDDFIVALMPVEDDINFGEGELRIKSAQRFPTFIGRVAKRYKQNKNVIYGIWVEPAGMKIEDYVEYIEKGVKEIRREAKEAVIIVDALNYGRKLDEVKKFKQMGNIVLDFHDYPAANVQGLTRFVRKWQGEFVWEKYVNQGLPILVGEFGGVWREDFSSDLDLWWIEQELKRIEARKVSYVMYTMDNEGGLSLFNGKGSLELSKKGKLFRNFLLESGKEK